MLVSLLLLAALLYFANFLILICMLNITSLSQLLIDPVDLSDQIKPQLIELFVVMLHPFLLLGIVLIIHQVRSRILIREGVNVIAEHLFEIFVR